MRSRGRQSSSKSDGEHLEQIDRLLASTLVSRLKEKLAFVRS